MPTDEVLEFMVYCTEMFRSRHGLSGSQVMDLFHAYGVLDYIEECYGALRTMGSEHIIEDIEGLIADGGLRRE